MCLRCQTLTLSVDLDGLEPEFKRVAKLIYAGKIKPGDIDGAMVKKIAAQLIDSFRDGYGNGAAMQPSFIENIKQNIYVFSGFKNYQQLKEASTLVVDNDGSYKPFHKWFNEIKQINGTYNEVYAKAEHANAIATAQSIRNWNDFQENGIKRLRFETAGDSRVRDEHRVLDGTVVDIDDPLLNKYYTPLDWGCRCEWVPAVDEDKTGWGDLPKIPPMFSTNVAKTGVIFPDTHPYFKGPKAETDKVEKQVFKIFGEVKEESKNVPYMLPNYEKTLGVKINRYLFDFLKKDVPLTNKGNKAFYDPNTDIVNIPFDERRKRSKWYSESVVYHEYGHAIDWQHGFRQTPEVKSLMDKYRRKYKSKFQELTDDVLDLASRAYFSNDFDKYEKVGALADTIMSLNTKYGYGHTKAYFANPFKKEAEFIAHSFENRFSGNDLFKELAPELYEDMIKLVDDFFKPKTNRKL